MYIHTYVCVCVYSARFMFNYIHIYIHTYIHTYIPKYMVECLLDTLTVHSYLDLYYCCVGGVLCVGVTHTSAAHVHTYVHTYVKFC